ncbi:MAG: hypothetical protein JWL65_7357 [Gammaproteobacteria bacterium]|nr:hypothetical protein [Gammaproteobacteria bacterium]
MTVSAKAAILVDLGLPSASMRCWAELGCTLQRVDPQTLQECASEPGSLEPRVRAQWAGKVEPTMLIISAGQQPVARAAAITNWDVVLHDPLARCFTAVRGLVPWIARSPRGGHVIAVLPRAALLPEASQGSAAVLGRALLGLFESLRAELRLTATRVTICIADDTEDADVNRARLRDVLSCRPFHSLPASIDADVVDRYFAPILKTLERTPRGTPLSAGPQGEVYRITQLRDASALKS